MAYTTTMTSKGQVTAPKSLRDRFHLRPSERLIWEAGKKEIKLRPSVDFVEVAKGIRAHISKKRNPLKARAYMEKHYGLG